MSAFAKLVGKRLREERKSAGFTQQRLADATGIHRPNIARIEHGKHMPSLETLARCAGALNVPVTRFVEAGRGRPVAPQQVAEFARAVSFSDWAWSPDPNTVA